MTFLTVFLLIDNQYAEFATFYHGNYQRVVDFMTDSPDQYVILENVFDNRPTHHNGLEIRYLE